MQDHILLRSGALAGVVLSEDDLKEFSPQVEILLGWEKGISKMAKQRKSNPRVKLMQEKLFTFSFEEESRCDEIRSHVKTEHGYFVVPKVIG
ncbi:glutamyl-tRNA amidotransferase [Neorickettsia findlayensis]|uniref:Glutamyl-tRNA amidotransferase n=1 Tax=Neorickettsia findlayensis TaxID=2686014 RepID=A0A6P1GA61_9RICK|nr:glutamyl-tRNA amidotransferase [Neorickettsia findlayensis]QHD65235.1 glutamyl-tRNA amidotransferase [Neorickettsia findlayensis]